MFHQIILSKLADEFFVVARGKMPLSIKLPLQDGSPKNDIFDWSTLG